MRTRRDLFNRGVKLQVSPGPCLATGTLGTAVPPTPVLPHISIQRLRMKVGARLETGATLTPKAPPFPISLPPSFIFSSLLRVCVCVPRIPPGTRSAGSMTNVPWIHDALPPALASFGTAIDALCVDVRFPAGVLNNRLKIPPPPPLSAFPLPVLLCRFIESLTVGRSARSVDESGSVGI
ncbi:hypothetical protein NMY22_g19979 [Coprinellus aureogranulatus]|nr:hypothetical protein NMY22_g19979 [Coprinellus aureogranulatus]